MQSSWAAADSYWTQRNTEAASGSLPDVMQFDAAALREYAENGRLLDLGPYTESGAIDVSGFDDATIDAGKVDGTQVVLPTGTNTLGFQFNPGLEAEVGVELPTDSLTVEEYNQFLLDVQAAGATTADGHAIYGGKDYQNDMWTFLHWLIQQDIEPFTEDGQLGFTQDDIARWLGEATEVREAGALYPVARLTAVTPMTGLTMEETITHPDYSTSLAGASTDSGLDDLELRPLFTVDGEPRKTFFRPAMFYAAGANSEHPEAAAVLIDFLLTDPEVGAIFGTSKGVPSDEGQRAAIEAEPGSVDARVLEFHEELAEGEVAPAPHAIRGFSTLHTKWWELTDELDYGNITVDDFVAEWWAEAEMAIG